MNEIGWSSTHGRLPSPLPPRLAPKVYCEAVVLINKDKPKISTDWNMMTVAWIFKGVLDANEVSIKMRCCRRVIEAEYRVGLHSPSPPSANFKTQTCGISRQTCTMNEVHLSNTVREWKQERVVNPQLCYNSYNAVCNISGPFLLKACHKGSHLYLNPPSVGGGEFRIPPSIKMYQLPF